MLHQPQLLPRNSIVHASLTRKDLEYFQLELMERETRLRRATANTDGDAQLERSLHELREIAAGLERLRSGTYGFCLRCGKAMDRARLELFPAARFDLCCMEREEIEHEQRHASAPDTPLKEQASGAPPP